MAGRIEEAAAECERGLEINPNASFILGDLGHYLAILGRPEEAVKFCRLALRLNPRDPANYWRYSSLAIAHFVAGDYENALTEKPDLTLSKVLRDIIQRFARESDTARLLSFLRDAGLPE